MSFLSELNRFEFVSVWVTLGIALLGLGYAWLLRGQVLRKDTGSARMRGTKSIGFPSVQFSSSFSAARSRSR